MMVESKMNNTRVSWRDPSRVKFFLDCCINEVARVGRSGSSLRKESWIQVAKQMKDKYKMNLTQKQMKNQFDYLRMMYMEWCKVIHKCSGDDYNAVSNTIHWPVDKWVEYLKDHPKASVFRMSSFKWAGESQVLFEGVSATGELGIRVTSGNPVPCNAQPLSSVPLIFSSACHAIEENSHDVEDESRDSQPSPDTPDTLESETKSERPLKRGKNCETVMDQKFLNDVDRVINDSKDDSNQQRPATQVPSMCFGSTLIRCCKMMDEVGLSPADDLYVQSAVIFSEKETREQWIQWCEITKDRIPRIKWLKNMLKLKKLT